MQIASFASVLTITLYFNSVTPVSSVRTETFIFRLTARLLSSRFVIDMRASKLIFKGVPSSAWLDDGHHGLKTVHFVPIIVGENLSFRITEATLLEFVRECRNNDVTDQVK